MQKNSIHQLTFRTLTQHATLIHRNLTLTELRQTLNIVYNKICSGNVLE